MSRGAFVLTPGAPSPVTLVMTLVTSLISGDEALDRPRRATDEESVDVGKGGERPCVAWVDAATVENRGLGAGPGEQIVAPGPYQFGNRLDNRGTGRGAAGADRPDGLIGDVKQTQVLRLNAIKADPQLPQDRLA